MVKTGDFKKGYAKVNDRDDDFWLYGNALKREGASVDGEVVGIKEKDALKCVKCRNCATALFAKKYGLLIKDLNKFGNTEYYCQNCRNFIGKCFICNKYFESNKDLSDINKTQITCKECK